MKRPSYPDLLRRLKLQLAHFERSPDYGDSESVAAIRRLLLLRIREIESVLACRPPVATKQVGQVEAA